MKLFILFFFSFIVINSSMAVVHRPVGIPLGEQGREFIFDFSNFSTIHQFDLLGQKQLLRLGDSFSLREMTLEAHQGASNKVSFRGAFRFRQVMAERRGVSVNNMGMESLLGGMTYGWKLGSKWRFTLDGQVRQTFYTNYDYDTSSEVPEDEIILGDSGIEMTALAHLVYFINPSWVLSNSFGYRMMAGRISGELPYSVFLSRLSRHSLWGGVKGIFSLMEEEPNFVGRKLQSTEPTLLFNSLNRSKVEISGGYKFAWKKHWSIGFYINQVLMGESVDAGRTFGLQFIWHQRSAISQTEFHRKTFKEYALEATVIKVSPQGKFCKIDHGLSEDVENGIEFDIFQIDYAGGNVLIASGKVIEVGSNWAIIKLTRKVKNKRVKSGMVARSHH